MELFWLDGTAPAIELLLKADPRQFWIEVHTASGRIRWIRGKRFVDALKEVKATPLDSSQISSDLQCSVLRPVLTWLRSEHLTGEGIPVDRKEEADSASPRFALLFYSTRSEPVSIRGYEVEMYDIEGNDCGVECGARLPSERHYRTEAPFDLTPHQTAEIHAEADFSREARFPQIGFSPHVAGCHPPRRDT